MIFTIQTTEMSLAAKILAQIFFYENYFCRLALCFRKLGLTTDYISQASVVVTFYTSVFQSPIPGKFLSVRKLLLPKALFLKLLGTGSCYRTNVLLRRTSPHNVLMQHKRHIYLRI